MINTKIFTVPNYYKNFSCKGGECRNSCCRGWDVTISRNDYFILQGVNCSKKVRQLIDKTFHVLDRPTPDRYAKILRTSNNDCPLHMDNGYCMLHAQCGEKVLPNICKYFP